jgi:hypothetical protein
LLRVVTAQVTRVARDTRGAPLYLLGAPDFDFAPGAAPNAPPRQRWLELRRAWGGASGGPPSVPADDDEPCNAAVTRSGANSLHGAFSGGYAGGASAAVAESAKGWTPFFYREHLRVPPLRDVPPASRPAAALAAGFAGAPGRRAAALLTLHGPIAFLLVALETGLPAAALQRRCVAAAWQFAAARGAAAAGLTAAAAYGCRAGAVAKPQRGIELLSNRAFWPGLIAIALAALAASLYAAVIAYAAASGGLALPVGPAATPIAAAEPLAPLCDIPGAGGPAACGVDALRRIALAWLAAALADQCVLWPLLLCLSEYVWRDGVARPQPADDEGTSGDVASEGAEDGAWGGGGGGAAAAAAASPQQQQRERSAAAEAAAAAEPGAWGGGGEEDGGGAWGGSGAAGPWRNPVYEAPSAPPAPPSTRAAALRVESAWG